MYTDDGFARLAAELEHADEVIDPPQLVYVLNLDTLTEQRATLYGRRRGAPPRLLVVWHSRGPVDHVGWICEPYVRPRRE